jgi:hypothetical protein
VAHGDLERECLVVISYQTPRYNAVETLFVSGIGISNSMPPKRRAKIKRSEEQTSEQRQKHHCHHRQTATVKPSPSPMPDHHSQVIIATAGPSLPDHHRPPPSHRHTHTTPPPPSPGLRDHVVIRCSQHPSHAAASPQQAYLPPNRIRLGFPQGQHSMRDESKPLLTVNPVAKPRVQHQIRLSQKQDTTRAKIAKNRGCTIEMHQAACHCRAKSRSFPSTLTRFDVLRTA